MKKSFLFISCDEAKHICDKVQYGEATKWEIFKLRIRRCYCRITKNYNNKNIKLTEAIKDGKIDCLKSEERNRLKKQFEEELAKHE
ncbi:hypothetical protein DFQ11_105116 [Winogradskyella epiphytica]|uniref:Uncharacterized protein n=1 Tax=Winogradskyella epiphytica TaxID=262005 RepID=A0A2V4X5Y9_9FLAO|nr:hypothetical protein [Winogradskyella epiphytica]PYE80519.1 hypothetical protein DFQ11_105116 [Winogradskyella epiphytica]GGW68881.1 hypothetical protein GCM10008085_20980 [Winogradskyella epiphytica]